MLDWPIQEHAPASSTSILHGKTCFDPVHPGAWVIWTPCPDLGLKIQLQIDSLKDTTKNQQNPARFWKFSHIWQYGRLYESWSIDITTQLCCDVLFFWGGNPGWRLERLPVIQRWRRWAMRYDGFPLPEKINSNFSRTIICFWHDFKSLLCDKLWLVPNALNYFQLRLCIQLL